MTPCSVQTRPLDSRQHACQCTLRGKLRRLAGVFQCERWSYSFGVGCEATYSQLTYMLLLRPRKLDGLPRLVPLRLSLVVATSSRQAPPARGFFVSVPGNASHGPSSKAERLHDCSEAKFWRAAHVFGFQQYCQVTTAFVSSSLVLANSYATRAYLGLLIVYNSCVKLTAVRLLNVGA